MSLRCGRSRKSLATILAIALFLFFCYAYTLRGRQLHLDLQQQLGRQKRLELKPFVLKDLSNRSSIIEYLEESLKDALERDKGTGCEMPHMDPFDKEVVQFDVNKPKVYCGGMEDWVRCHHATCHVTKRVLQEHRDVTCTFRDILYQSDKRYTIGQPKIVKDGDVFVLEKSDFAIVSCTGTLINTMSWALLRNLFRKRREWTGVVAGLRNSVKTPAPPPGREKTLNVLMLGFDSTSKNGFIRRMPKSYAAVVDLNATVLNGYNIIGDGTPASLIPLMTGDTELELPDVRRSSGTATVDAFPFVFYKLKDDGYRTLFFEDSPAIGTYNYRFNGFARQPTDHYAHAFFTERQKHSRKYCVGDTPQYGFMMNMTKMFFEQDGKKYAFTFIVDITHDDFNMISSADEDLERFLRSFWSEPRKEDTLMMLFGDHGPRYAHVRSVYRGKLEERLPLMAIFLPERLKRQHPQWVTNLGGNANVLTTPHDIYATMMHALDLKKHWNPYKVPGADLKRGLTLFEPIPSSRSCSEAGIEAHWCTCMRWVNVSSADKVYEDAARALLDFINGLTSSQRAKCVERTLTSIHWVMRQQAKPGLLKFKKNWDKDGYVGRFDADTQVLREDISVKISVGPAEGVFEATMVHSIKDGKYEISSTSISRTNAYNNEPWCISKTHPHLNPYCYCKD